MSAKWKLLNSLKRLKNCRTVLTAATVGVTGTATTVSRRTDNENPKDKIVFLSKEENKVCSKANIEMKELGEFRGPVHPNGDLNWACACIERDVTGPCNNEFRKLRGFMHTNDIRADFADFDEKLQGQFDKLFGDFILCTMEYPVYYEDQMLEEEKEEKRMIEEKIRQLEEKKRQEREKNTRLFGKDKVVFLTKEENRSPVTVVIPQVPTEENRDPVLPNGDINWACTCIEKDVIGPCNIEFREFRNYVAKTKTRNENEDISEEGKEIIMDFLECIRSNPTYYKSVLSRGGDDDADDDNENKD